MPSISCLPVVESPSNRAWGEAGGEEISLLFLSFMSCARFDASDSPFRYQGCQAGEQVFASVQDDAYAPDCSDARADKPHLLERRVNFRPPMQARDQIGDCDVQH